MMETLVVKGLNKQYFHGIISTGFENEKELIFFFFERNVFGKSRSFQICLNSLSEPEILSLTCRCFKRIFEDELTDFTQLIFIFYQLLKELQVRSK